MSIEAKLIALGLELPPAAKPVGAYVPCKRIGDMVYTSGMLPLDGGIIPLPGRLGAEIDIDEGRASARLALLNALAAVRETIGSLDDIAEVVRLEGFVASTSQFRDQPQVLNGASALLFDIFGEAGRHTRYAVGVAVLPLNAPVELALWLRLHHDKPR